MKINKNKEKTIERKSRDIIIQISKMELEKLESEKKLRKFQSIIYSKNSELTTLHNAEKN